MELDVCSMNVPKRISTTDILSSQHGPEIPKEYSKLLVESRPEGKKRSFL